MHDAVLRLSSLSASFGSRVLFSHLDLSLERGESLALVGPSGVGKTTLLNCILGVVRPSSGRILVAGEDVTALKGHSLARLRSSHIGMVFQSGELIGELSPLENVAIAGLIAGNPRSQAFARAHDLLEAFGVPLQRATCEELSGGERQRTALARALANRPSVVLADEPTGSLDPETRDRVADVLFASPVEWGCALVVATHDPEIASRATRRFLLASPEKSQSPQHEPLDP